jgi:hypothetical protein
LTPAPSLPWLILHPPSLLHAKNSDSIPRFRERAKREKKKKQQPRGGTTQGFRRRVFATDFILFITVLVNNFIQFFPITFIHFIQFLE